jgi:hypothetical protein
VFEGEKAFMFKDMTQKGFENHPELQVSMSSDLFFLPVADVASE